MPIHQTNPEEPQLYLELTMAQLEDMDRRLRILEQERNLLIDYPHSIWTVADVLEIDLNREARKKAGLLAHLIYKHVHNSDPVKVMLPNIGDPSRYSEKNLWMLRSAIKRVHEGANSPAPQNNLLANKDWTRFCDEACV